MRGIIVISLCLLPASFAIAQGNRPPRLPPPLLDLPAVGTALSGGEPKAPSASSTVQPSAVQPSTAVKLESLPASRDVRTPASGTPSVAAEGVAVPPAAEPADKHAAIQSLIGELQSLSPDANDKLLDMLQLERLDALRNQQIDITREFALSTGGGADSRSVQRAFALRTSIWLTTAIPVTWDVPADVFEQYQEECNWVREAIELTWERESALRFTGWTRSENATSGIRIRINDEGPHCKRLGRFLDGLTAGMVLNFTFNNWCEVCAINRKNSIQFIAVHEFGHAIGLAHEANRPDAPTWCQQERQGSDGDWNVTVYDPESIMNYCSSKWNNDGQLTELDKRAARIMYGNPTESEVRPRAAPFSQPLRAAASSEVIDIRPQSTGAGSRDRIVREMTPAGQTVRPGCPCDVHKALDATSAELKSSAAATPTTTPVRQPSSRADAAHGSPALPVDSKPSIAADPVVSEGRSVGLESSSNGTGKLPTNAARTGPRMFKERSKQVVMFQVWLDSMEGPRRGAENLARSIKVLGESYREYGPSDAKCTVENATRIPFQGAIANKVSCETLRLSVEGANRRIDDETTVVFIFVGHGSVDNRDNDARKLNLDGDEVVDRASIVTYLRDNTAARLVVFITESCAGLAFPELPREERKFATLQNFARLFEQLFVKPHGVVDIASSTFERDPATGNVIGEYSWCPKAGGVFGNSLVEVLVNPPDPVISALNGGSNNVWPEVFCATVENTARNYAAFRDPLVIGNPTAEQLAKKFNTSAEDAGRLLEQSTQRPQAFGLAGRTAECEGVPR